MTRCTCAVTLPLISAGFDTNRDAPVLSFHNRYVNCSIRGRGNDIRLAKSWHGTARYGTHRARNIIEPLHRIPTVGSLYAAVRRPQANTLIHQD